MSLNINMFILKLNICKIKYVHKSSLGNKGVSRRIKIIFIL